MSWGFLKYSAFSQRAIWLDLSDSPTGCLATEREVEYFKRGCSLTRTRQLAGAMAFCNTKATKTRPQLWIKKKQQKKQTHTPLLSHMLHIGWPHCERVLWAFAPPNRKPNLHQLTAAEEYDSITVKHNDHVLDSSLIWKSVLVGS